MKRSSPQADPALPKLGHVFAEQLRTSGRALRTGAGFGAAAVAAVTLLVWASGLGGGGGLQLTAGVVQVAAFAALVTPGLVWRGEFGARRPVLATFPVGRTRHALLKVAAGWVWLMALTLAFSAWIAAWAWASGTAPPGWLWAAPAGASTIAYLGATTVVLAGARTRLLLAAAAVGALVPAALLTGSEGWAQAAIQGRLGLTTLVEGGALHVIGALGGRAVRFDPVPAAWPAAMALWFGLALAATVASVRFGRLD